jgi:hemerythrin-like domain-containing protein
MSATASLREEHAVILQTLDVLEGLAGRAADDVDPLAWPRLLAWLGSFADERHHAKEERLLFPALEAAGLPRDGGPIAVMLEEHEAGRALVRAMGEAPVAERRRLAREYACLLRAHIAKENDVLFELADALLGPREVERLLRAYEAADLATI